MISALHPEDEDQSFNSLSDLVREEGDPPCSHPCHARCCTLLLLLLLYDEVIENKYLLISEKAVGVENLGAKCLLAVHHRAVYVAQILHVITSVDLALCRECACAILLSQVTN